MKFFGIGRSYRMIILYGILIFLSWGLNYYFLLAALMPFVHLGLYLLLEDLGWRKGQIFSNGKSVIVKG